MNLIELLHQKVDGLLYLSETEHPLIPFNISTTNAEEIPELLAACKQTEIQFVTNISSETFFARFENYLAYGGADEWMNDNARAFIGLREFLQKNFTQTLIYRIQNPGQAEIPVFIICKLTDGRYTGLQTTAVET